MNTQEVIGTARKMVAEDKGLLAMDESDPTCNKRFAKLAIPQTEEARRASRELIVTTPGLGESISGAILYDETIRQRKREGTLFVKVLTNAGIISGIKVDTGAQEMVGHRGERITEGLDRLRRLAEHSRMARAVISVCDGIPSQASIEAHAQALARYAALCQEAGLVPVVEPEVLMDGEHARAIQQPALEVWQGQEARVLAAQQALIPGATWLRAVANSMPRWTGHRQAFHNPIKPRHN